MIRLIRPLADARPELHLNGRRLFLRPPAEHDWEAWSELRQTSREFLMPWEPVWPRDALSRSTFRHRLRRYNTDIRDGTGYSFLLFRRGDEGLLGGITLSNVRRGVAQCASLGYWIGEPHARKGYMTEAIGSLLDFAFGELDLNRVEAACLPNNTASRGLLQKCGFSEEGYARSYLRINGRWHDHQLYAILRGDPRPRNGV